jgi:hypothetical protein
LVGIFASQERGKANSEQAVRHEIRILIGWPFGCSWLLAAPRAPWGVVVELGGCE